MASRRRSDPESLASALEHVLRPDVAARARSIAPRVRGDGARIAAQRLIAIDPRPQG